MGNGRPRKTIIAYNSTEQLEFSDLYAICSYFACARSTVNKRFKDGMWLLNNRTGKRYKVKHKV